MTGGRGQRAQDHPPRLETPATLPFESGNPFLPEVAHRLSLRGKAHPCSLGSRLYRSKVPSLCGPSAPHFVFNFDAYEVLPRLLASITESFFMGCFHHRSRLHEILPSWCPSTIRAAKPRHLISVLPVYHNGREAQPAPLTDHPPLARRCFSRPCPFFSLPGAQSSRAALPRWVARKPHSSERCPVSPCPGHRPQPRCPRAWLKAAPAPETHGG